MSTSCSLYKAANFRCAQGKSLHTPGCEGKPNCAGSARHSIPIFDPTHLHPPCL